MEDLLERRRMLMRQSASVDPYLLQPFTINITSGSGRIEIWDYSFSMTEPPLTSIYINKNNTGWVQGVWDTQDCTFYFGGSMDISVAAGDIVQVKATGVWATNTTTDHLQFYATNSSIRCTLSGNINSLVHGDNFVGATSMPARALVKIFGAEQVGDLGFQECITDISNLRMPATELGLSCYHSLFYRKPNLTTVYPYLLPATTLANHCYNSMFYYCSSLVSAPELPALELTTQCYREMFRYCTNLKYIKAMFLTAPTSSATGPTGNWVYNVYSGGTFVKNVNATWTTRGNHGVPTGWTIEYASS